MIDGLTNEWAADESLFQLNDSDPARVVPEEGLSDSEWGFNNDIKQVHVTWDAAFLYVAVDAIIWNNNVLLLFDYAPGGMTSMTQLNSWRRNFVFQGIAPDMFLATWDGNTQPQVWNAVTTNTVMQRAADSFITLATFSQGTQGRAMEAAIPWSFLFTSAVADSVWPLPPEITELKVVAVLTAGGDGTGGPDSAPDNLQGHQNDSSQQVTIDNWVTIPLDLTGPSGGPDGIADFDADIRERASFRVRPPVRGIRQEISAIDFNAAIISPEQGGRLEFTVSLTPEIPPAEDYRTVAMTAEVFNVAGDRVRTLYTNNTRSAADPVDPALDVWNGRDDNGRLVDGGIYLLRLVLEPESQRKVRAFSVVR